MTEQSNKDRPRSVGYLSVDLHFVHPYLKLGASDVSEVTWYCRNAVHVSQCQFKSHVAVSVEILYALGL
jgi:hypothetical protein